jgi:hypothetical protein
MAFKKALPHPAVPDSPDELFRDLPRRKIPDVLPHQREIMRSYAALKGNDPDVAFQLPTGSGKTLVGLLIAEWRRRKNQERVVYLCPTRQLVNQVVEQAKEKYGLTVNPFLGSIKKYDPSRKAEYRSSDRIAITTYSSLFNTNPFFHDADVLIVDDAHAGEGYISKLWALPVSRIDPKHAATHAALLELLKPLIDSSTFVRISGKWDGAMDRSWVDKIPTPEFTNIIDELTEIFDVHSESAELQHSWSVIRGHLHACHCYLSTDEILIRPLIPPTSTHAAFSDPKQRVYMSATLGAGGDLERLVGRSPIKRLPVPQSWDRQAVGRRFFMFPSMSLKDDDAVALRRDLMRSAGRSLVLVPSDRLREQIAKDVTDTLDFPTFSADDIEQSKKDFVSTEHAVAVVANRYDGIDFPGDECRLLFIEGLPKAMNIQERFLMTRMGANVLFNERIQTRVLQAIGRCTRSLEDYSAVVISGDELPDYLADVQRRKFLHPELQAELKFGVEQSKGVKAADMLENFQTFLRNDKEWEQVNEQIVSSRKQMTQMPFPALDELSAAVSNEISYQNSLWQGDYESAGESAEKVLGGLTKPELRGYRALWHYLAGAAAWLGAADGVAALGPKARIHFGHAKKATTAIPWLVRLARYEQEGSTGSSDGGGAQNEIIVMQQIERIEAVLAHLGTTHDRSYAKREKEIIEGLQSKEEFEEAHRLLGELLGFEVGKVEADGSPDPWWLAGKFCLVFEDHAGAEENAVLDVKKARQVSSHPAWIRANVEGSANSEILPVLVTPALKAKPAALPHLTTVSLWPLAQFREWASSALSTLRELRKTFVEPGNLIWRANTAETLNSQGISAPLLFSKLKLQNAGKHLKPES